MNITAIGHAGLYINTKDCNILCDPWKHENPQFFGSWYVYPDNSNLHWDIMIQNTDYLYVSHTHKDHFDSKFLTELANRNKKVRVILPDYFYPFLKEELNKIGFNKFIIGEFKCGDTTMVTYPANTVDREREDSALVVDEDFTFLNFNDSTIELSHKKDILKRFKTVEMAAGQFSGANWWPICYENYSQEELKKMCVEYRERKSKKYLKIMNYLEIDKMVHTSGPPCFLDKKLAHLNWNSIFFDSWEVPEFDEIDNIYRVIPGDQFNYNNIVDRKVRPFSKKEFINSRLYESNDGISDDEWIESKKKFLHWMDNIIKNSKWLRKYISQKLYLSIDGYQVFHLNFRKSCVDIYDKVNYRGAYYLVKIPPKIFYELVMEKYTDWEEAFLSSRLKFTRIPDKYNPWILSFFRNLDVDKLNKINENKNSSKITEEKIQVGNYKIDKYCPHQQYDLSHHGKVDLDKCTIQCLGHGWTWNIKTGKGINCGFDLNTERIIGE